jgi:hypothetical protein
MENQDILLFLKTEKFIFRFHGFGDNFQKANYTVLYLGPYSKQKTHRCFRYMKNLQAIQYGTCATGHISNCRSRRRHPPLSWEYGHAFYHRRRWFLPTHELILWVISPCANRGCRFERRLQSHFFALELSQKSGREKGISFVGIFQKATVASLDWEIFEKKPIGFKY